MPSKTCIVVSGPTAVGKTSVAIQLAQHFKTSIISADSRQCFRETSIGVAKPTEQELGEARHYFINSHSVHDNLTAAGFEQYALDAINEIFAQNDLAIMVGGTGLYIKAFIEGLDQIPNIDPSLRNSIVNDYETNGINWLKSAIEKEDPSYFSTGEQDNPQRMMRALEVVRSTGKSIRHFQSGLKKTRSFQVIHIGLKLPRDVLVERINRRVDQMIKDGLVEEAQGLYALRHLNALQTVGYSELFEYFEGKTTLDKAIELIKIHTRQYAKRQVTWFSKAGVEAFFSPESLPEMINFVEHALQAPNR